MVKLNPQWCRGKEIHIKISAKKIDLNILKGIFFALETMSGQQVQASIVSFFQKIKDKLKRDNQRD